MKIIIFITVMIIGLSASFSMAQMGHGMMRGGHMDDSDGHMMDSSGHMQLDDIFTRKQKMGNEMPIHDRQMVNGMMGATQDMAIMMRQMSVMMGNISEMESQTGTQEMQRMSAMMKDMAMEMNRISGMMVKGSSKPEEVRAMQGRVIKLQEQMRELRR